MSDAVADSSPLQKPARDGRLDFWRGLCLVDMVLVHLIYEGVRMGKILTPWIGEFTRFAAGGFIFLAGLAVSLAYLKIAPDPQKRAAAYQSLWKRSLYLLGVHYAASLSFVFIYPLRDYNGPYPQAWPYIKDVLLLREGTDLLVFYVIMIAVAPALLELMRCGMSWLIIVLSIALFTLGQWHPNLLSLAIQKGFLIILWQLIFIAGLFAGALLPKYDLLSLRAKIATCIATIASAITLSMGAWGGWNLGMAFSKNPLTIGEALRYIAIISSIAMLTDLAWRRIQFGHLTAFVSRLGKRSLAVYVAHVWVVALIVSAARRMDWLGGYQILLAAVALLLLWAWTIILATLSAPKPAKVRLSMFAPVMRKTAAALGAVLLLFSLHSAIPASHSNRAAKLLAQLNTPANLASQIADAMDAEPNPIESLFLPDLPFDEPDIEDITPYLG